MNAVAPLSADMPSRLLARCRSTVALSSFGPYRDCRPTTLLTSTCSFAWKASRPSRSRERRAAARCCTHHTEAGVDSDGVCGDGAGVLLPGADDHREWGRRWASKSCEGRAVRSGCAESGRRDAGAAPARKLRINIHACTRHAHTCTHARAHMHTHARSHTHTHTHTHSQSHVHMYVYMSYVHHLLSHTNTASSPPPRSRRHAADKGDSAANSAQKKQKQAATLHRDVLVRPPAQRCPNPHHQSGEI